jgi:hypothetical protein
MTCTFGNPGARSRIRGHAKDDLRVLRDGGDWLCAWWGFAKDGGIGGFASHWDGKT